MHGSWWQITFCHLHSQHWRFHSLSCFESLLLLSSLHLAAFLPSLFTCVPIGLHWTYSGNPGHSPQGMWLLLAEFLCRITCRILRFWGLGRGHLWDERGAYSFYHTQFKEWILNHFISVQESITTETEVSSQFFSINRLLSWWVKKKSMSHGKIRSPGSWGDSTCVSTKL